MAMSFSRRTEFIWKSAVTQLCGAWDNETTQPTMLRVTRAVSRQLLTEGGKETTDAQFGDKDKRHVDPSPYLTSADGTGTPQALIKPRRHCAFIRLLVLIMAQHMDKIIRSMIFIIYFGFTKNIVMNIWLIKLILS